MKCYDSGERFANCKIIMYLKLLNSYYLHQISVLLFLVIKLTLSCSIKQPFLIYILKWTTSQDWAYLSLGTGQDAFIKRNCSFQNCFLINNRSYFSDILDFDVLLFNVIHIALQIADPPPIRSPSQLYVLVGIEPPVYHPISPKFNSIFNMTWSYKLTASILYPYISIRNKRGEIIGPRRDMHWEYNIENMAIANKYLISKLRHKKIAAAVVLSRCNASSGRDEFITSLKKELLRYGQQVDVYGGCKFANLRCPSIAGEKNGVITGCASQIETYYYFYLAFENSICEDYVSEKLLHGLNHLAVPVVYGGANYTRFMPHGMYLNARALGVKKLAEEMNAIILDKSRYYDFFKWHGYYTFYDTHGIEYYDKYYVCNICAKLNNRIRKKRSSTYRNIVKWWNANHTLIETTSLDMTTKKNQRYHTVIETTTIKMPVDKNVRNRHTLIKSTISKMSIEKNQRKPTLIENTTSKMPVEKKLPNHYPLTESTTSKMQVKKHQRIYNSSVLRDLVPNLYKLLFYTILT